MRGRSIKFHGMVLGALAGGAAVLAGAGPAAAAPPAWCKDAASEAADLQKLSSRDPRDVIKTFVAVECAPSAEIEAHRGDIETARQAWSKRLGMAEADWADAVVYARTHDDSQVPADVSVKNLAQATPLDQYAVVRKAGEALSDMDALYAADMFEPNLTEAGRLGFVQAACFNHNQPALVDGNGMTGTEVIWGICQADLERIDVAKLFGEIRGDAAHDGALRMKLRIAAYELPARIKAHGAEVQQMLQRDVANAALFKIAGEARSEWASGIGKNAKLLALVLTMDSAALSQSRKLLEGCAETTAAALTEAVSTIPARAFAGMHDAPGDGLVGFAAAALPVLAATPAVNLAAIAAVRCSTEGDLAPLWSAVVDTGPPSRGPRSTALARIASTHFDYDKVGAALVYARAKPYGNSYPGGGAHPRSSGGTIKSVKRAGDTLTIESPRKLVRTEDCVRSHQGKAVKLHDDGHIEYESICDKTQIRTHDRTDAPFHVSAKYAAWLAPGAVYSAIGTNIIAVWPSATAKTPSMVLGTAVK